MAVVFKNNAKTTLASGINSSATSITVSDGSVFPSLTGSDIFFVTFDDGTNNEIVKVTARSGNTLTVVRAQESTTARSFSTGDEAQLRLTAGILGLFSQTGVAITDEIEAYLDANGLTFPDDTQARFGTDNDLTIDHNSSTGNSRIIDNSGVLNIQQSSDDGQIRFQCDDGSGGVTTYYQISGTGETNTFFKDIKLGDNVKALFGTGNDLQIYHSSFDTYLTNSTGHLVLQNQANDKDIVLQTDNGSGGTADYLRLVGANTRMLASQHFRIADTKQLQLGDDNDFSANFNGNHTFLTNNTGILYLTQNVDDGVIRIRNDNGSGGVTDYINLHGGTGEVRLSHYGTVKLKTTTNGVDVPSGGLFVGGTEVITSARNLTNIGAGSFSDTVSINQGASFSKLQIGTGRTGATENIGAVEFLNSSSALKAQVYGSNDGKLRLTTNGSTVALTLDASQNATFAGTISSGNITATQLTVDDITINGSTVSDAGTLTVDSGGDIILDADSDGRVFFFDGGTEYGNVGKSSNSLILKSAISDGDILFQGNDGGSTITALTLDMSNAGSANFNNNIVLGDSGIAIFGAGSDLKIQHNGSNSFIDNETGGLYIRQKVDDGDVFIQSDNSSGGLTTYFRADGSNGQAQLFHYGSQKLNTTSSGVSVTGTLTATTYSGALASTVTATTQSAGDNSTKVATTAYTDTAIANLADSAPSTLNTLNELAAALGDDANFSTTVTNSIATKLPLAGGTMTGQLLINVSGAGTTAMDVQGAYSSGGDVKLAQFKRSGGAVAAAIEYNDATTDMEFGTVTSHAFSLKTADTRRLTIDTSGNLLVGTTDNNVTNNSGNNPGINIGVAGIKGYIASARYQGAPLALNRLNNDGDIAVFQKDGTTIGVIGTKSGDLIAGTGDTGIRFDDANNAIYAHNTSTNAYVDDSISLGFSGIRFKDLYLSGQVKAQTLFIDSGGFSPSDDEGKEFKYYLVGQGTDQNFKKVADVTISTGSYKSLALRVVLESQAGNFGNTVAVDKTEYVCIFYRSAATLNSEDTAVISGADPTHHSLRIVKTASGVYELQVKQNANYKDAILKLEVLSTNGGTFTVTDGNVNGSTSGTITTPTSSESASTYSFNKVDTPFLNIQNTIKVNSTQILDSSRNLSNIGTISSGGITSSGVVTATSGSGHRFGRLTLRDDSIEEQQTNTDTATVAISYNGYAGGTTKFRDFAIFDGKQQAVARFDGSDKTLNVVSGYQLNGTTVMDSSRNLTNIGTASIGGTATVGNLDIPANGTADTRIEVGTSTSSNHNAFLDLVGDTTYSDYGLRLIRFSAGANTNSQLVHRGTGGLFIEAQDAGSVILKTNGSDGLTINSSQNAVFGGVVGIGGTSTSSSYGIWLQNNKWYATQYSSSHDVVRMNANTAGGLDIYNQTDSAFAVIRTGGVNIGSTQVIDGSRNLTNIGTVSCGAITTTGFFNINASHTVYAGLVHTTSTATTSYNVIRFTQGSGSGAPTGLIGTAGSAVGNTAFRSGMNIGTQTSGSLNFIINDGYVGKFDTSGNLLVSKTSSDLTTDGIELRDTGGIVAIRTNGDPLYLNRKSTDGAISTFAKDGTQVGVIGVLNSNNLTITCNTADHGGLQFGTHSITPMEAGSDANGTIDLGSANSKFKDLYLAGDIFLPYGSINDSGTDLVIHGTNAVVLKTDGGTAITIPNNSTDINLGSGKLNFSRTSEAILLDSAHSKTKIGLYGGIGTGAEYIGTSANTVEISGTNINFNGASGSGTPNLKMGTTTVIDSSRVLQNVTFTNSILPVELKNNHLMAGANAILRMQETDVTNSPTWWTVADGGTWSVRLNNTGTYPISIATNSDNNAVSQINIGYNTIFAGTINSGAITATATSKVQATSGTNRGVELSINGEIAQTSSDASYLHIQRYHDGRVAIGNDSSSFLYVKNYIDVVDNYRLNNTVIVDSSRNLTNIGTITSGDITIADAPTPVLTLSDTNNGGGGGASGMIKFKNSSGDAMGIGYTANVVTDSDMIISTNAGGTYGGYLGLDANGITDAQSDIILEPKTNVRIATGSIEMGTTVFIDQNRNLTNIGTISSGAITSTGGITSSSSGFIEHRVDQTDSGLVRMGVSSGSAEAFIIAGNTGGNHVSSAPVIKFMLDTDGGSLVEEVRIDAAGLDIKNGALDIAGTTVIDSSRNLSNIGTIDCTNITCGNVTPSGEIFLGNQKEINFAKADGSNDGTKLERAGGNALRLKYTGNSLIFDALNDNQVSFRNSDDEEYIRFIPHNNPASSALDFLGSLRHGTTTIINSSRNLLNIGTISSGAITSSGDITAFSDERLKDNIQTLDGKKALQMRGVSFIRDGKEGSGVIAQEIEKIAPELVATADDEQGTKSVAYGNLVGYLIEAIKDQQDQIEYMKSEIKVLKEANNGNK